MTTISVSLDSKTEKELDELVEITDTSRVGVINKAIELYREDEAVNAVIKAEQEISEGEILRGDVKSLLQFSD